MKILMVCLGNFCRSPLAEGILQHKAQQAGLNWVIDSAGTGAHQPGCAPHQHSQKVARLYGIDICHQQCRQFTPNDMLEFDRIYVMDSENYRDVQRLSRSQWDPRKVDMIMNEVYPGKDIEVPDPWYGGEDGYHKVYDMIALACDAIIKKYGTIQQEKEQPA